MSDKHTMLHIDYADKVPDEALKIDPEIVISEIDEIKNMEENCTDSSGVARIKRTRRAISFSSWPSFSHRFFYLYLF